MDRHVLLELFGVAMMGAMGALCRLGLTRWLGSGRIPWGTLAANVIGSFALGLLVALTLHGELVPRAWRVPLTTGFLGALTTFSTFSVETVMLVQAGDGRGAALNLVAQLSLGLVAAAGGLLLGRVLLG